MSQKLKEIFEISENVAFLYFQDGLKERRVAKIIADNMQTFPEKTAREYHNLTAGWIMNEIVRKVTPENTTLGKT